MFNLNNLCLIIVSVQGFLNIYTVYIISCWILLGLPRRHRPRPRYNQNINGGILRPWSPATSKADLVEAQDGSAGTHRTINEALAALTRMGRTRPQRVVIYVKSGVYDEKVEIARHMNNIMFVGDGIDRTIVTGHRNVPDGSTTSSPATFGRKLNLINYLFNYDYTHTDVYRVRN